MAWNLIGSYLNRFKEVKPPKEFVQSSAAQVIAGVTNISIDPKHMEFRNGVVYIKIPNPAMKNQIFCCKQKILEQFTEIMGPKAPKDILFGN